MGNRRVMLGGIAGLNLALLLAIGIASTALAEPYSGIGQASPKIAVYPYSYNSTWQTPMNQSLTNWNNTYSPVSLTKSTLSGSSITAASYADTWYGYYQACGDTCLYIRLNSRTIAADATNFGNFVQSVLVHEYGHALYLGHRDGEDSIMNRNRNRNTMTKPTASDAANVRSYYPTWPSS